MYFLKVMVAPRLEIIRSLFENRTTYVLDRHQYWTKYWPVIVSSCILFLVVLFWRSWPNFTHPALYAEDTTHYFSFFYGDSRDLSSLFHHPNGYQVILTNFIAKLVAKLDVRLQPTAYLAIGLPIAIVAVMLLPFSGLLRNKYLIFLAPFLLGLSGMNHLYYYTTLAYQIYSFVLILLGLLLLNPLKSMVSNALLFLFLSLLIFSGPYSVLVVPFSLCFIVFFKGKTRLLVALCIVTIIYALTLSEHTIQLRFLFKSAIYPIWLNTLVGRVFFMNLFGGTDIYKLVAIVVFFCLVFFFLRKDTFYLKIACILLVLINSSLAALFLSIKFVTALIIRPCYLVIPQFLWMVFLLFTFDKLLMQNKKLQHAGLVVCCLAALFILYDNKTIAAKRKLPIQYALPAFLERVHQAEKEDLRGQNRVVLFTYTYGKTIYHPAVALGKIEDPAIPVEIVEFAE